MTRLAWKIQVDKCWAYNLLEIYEFNKVVMWFAWKHTWFDKFIRNSYKKHSPALKFNKLYFYNWKRKKIYGYFYNETMQ